MQEIFTLEFESIVKDFELLEIEPWSPYRLSWIVFQSAARVF